MPDSENGRVTLAIIGQKLDNIEDLLKQTCTQQRQDHDTLASLTTDFRSEVERIDGDIKRVQDKQGVWAAAQGIFAVVMAAIASYIGSK